jgi:hypothetical protein
MPTKEQPRFEVRCCRTGYIECVFATIQPAIAFAEHYKAEGYGPCVIVDTALPIVPGDFRIVWQDDYPRPRAYEWIKAHQSELGRKMAGEP